MGSLKINGNVTPTVDITGKRITKITINGKDLSFKKYKTLIVTIGGIKDIEGNVLISGIGTPQDTFQKDLKTIYIRTTSGVYDFYTKTQILSSTQLGGLYNSTFYGQSKFVQMNDGTILTTAANGVYRIDGTKILSTNSIVHGLVHNPKDDSVYVCTSGDGVLDLDGNTIVSTEILGTNYPVSGVEFLENGTPIFSTRNLGVINKEGNILLSYNIAGQINSMTKLDDNTIIVLSNTKGVLDLDGNVLNNDFYWYCGHQEKVNNRLIGYVSGRGIIDIQEDKMILANSKVSTTYNIKSIEVEED